MQGQDGGALMWSVAVQWVCRPWGFLGSAGHVQPPPLFCLGHPAYAIQQSEMAATCAGLGDSWTKRDNGLCSPRCQILQSLAVYHWGPSSSHPIAGAQRVGLSK